MTVTTPLVNGTSYCTVTAYSADSYKQAIDFYSKFLSLEDLTSNAQEQSTTISNGSISIKIQLKENPQQQSQVANQLEQLKAMEKTQDWRSHVQESLVFSTANILINKETLTALQYPTQSLSLIHI